MNTVLGRMLILGVVVSGIFQFRSYGAESVPSNGVGLLDRATEIGAKLSADEFTWKLLDKLNKNDGRGFGSKDCDRAVDHYGAKVLVTAAMQQAQAGFKLRAISEFAPLLVGSNLQVVDSIVVSPELLGFECESVRTHSSAVVIDSIRARFKYHVVFSSSAEKFFRNGVLFQDNADIPTQVRTLDQAMANLLLMPEQRKALAGFRSVVTRFVQTIAQEEAKHAKKDESAMFITDIFFVEQAHQLASYYRIANEQIKACGQLCSEKGGVNPVNDTNVEAVDRALKKVLKTYGLDRGTLVSRRAADYARVLVDTIQNRFEPLLEDENKKKFTKPLLIQLGMITSVSDAHGDVSALELIKAFQPKWEHGEFQTLLEGKISATDEKLNTMILDMQSLAHSLGNVANIDIRVFDAFHAEGVRRSKAGKK